LPALSFGRVLYTLSACLHARLQWSGGPVKAGSINQSTNQPINQSTNQSVNQPTNQSQHNLQNYEHKHIYNSILAVANCCANYCDAANGFAAYQSTY
jgi:hypothetical protein